MKEFIISALPVLGTILGGFLGVVASAKLTNFRLEQLEKKVDMHNSFASRIPVIEQRLDSDEERLAKLERKVFDD